jgi:UDP-N-acetylmuramate--alanine ligase
MTPKPQPSYHFIGVGGIGMSGLAELLVRQGCAVSGSDAALGAITDRLAELGVRCFQGHRPEHLDGAEVVVYSSAIKEHNPELAAARAQGLEVVHRGRMLARLMAGHTQIAITGAHGKTSTTAMTGAILRAGGLDPTVLVGALWDNVGSNAVLGAGRYFVAEADESDGSFALLSPQVTVITNLDREHLDHWKGGLPEIEQAFVDFANKVPFYGLCVVCAEDPLSRGLLPKLERRIVTYGATVPATFRVGSVTTHEDFSLSFDVYEKDFLLGRARLRMPGRHNALNALAAVAVGRELGLGAGVIFAALERFEGVGRRFEVKGEEDGILVVDDYGHHPNEIAAVLRSAKDHSRRRTVVVFQPHRYTRTRDLLPEFAGCFDQADLVFVAPIYSAGEDPIPGADSDSIVQQLVERGHPACRALSDLEGAPAAIRPHLRSGDLVITLGAGSITRLGDALLRELADHGVGARG